MNYKIVLYNKTFSRDFTRTKRLLESINEYNIDDIPFFISCPKLERNQLETTIGTEGYEFIADEDIWQFENKLDGWRSQQIVKSNLWKTIDVDNYVCVDSDQFFIRNFFETDFLHPSDTPYSLVHENKEVQQYEKLLLGKNYRENNYVKAVQAYRSTFSQPKHSKIYDFGPPPYIWSTAVWQHFEDNVLLPNDLNFETFQIGFETHYRIPFREAITYGEYLLASRIIPIHPTSGLFKFYHWKEMYDFEQETKLGLEENIKENFLGITLQSNWS
jgi:hypothetical protein|tara:strand:+ start:997 stop:1815 length:819 start_codon:yes stop_codon:yes gene_type:complete